MILLLPFGYDVERLKEIFKIGKKRKQYILRKKLEELIFIS